LSNKVYKLQLPQQQTVLTPLLASHFLLLLHFRFTLSTQWMPAVGKPTYQRHKKIALYTVASITWRKKQTRNLKDTPFYSPRTNRNAWNSVHIEQISMLCKSHEFCYTCGGQHVVLSVPYNKQAFTGKDIWKKDIKAAMTVKCLI
jgi:hypothetical protein